MKILSDEEMKKIEHSYIRDSTFYWGAACYALCEAQHKDTLRQVRELLDGIENPHKEIIQAMSAPEDMCENRKWRGFKEAIKRMKTLLEE